MKYFTLKELIKSNIAEKYGIHNIPSKGQEKKLIKLIDNILDPAREEFKAPIYVHSGFRCPKLNKKVGGAKNSQHTKAEAVDLVCHNNIKLLEILKKLNFDQLIIEKPIADYPSWLHVSYVDNNRNEILIYKNGKYKRV